MENNIIKTESIDVINSFIKIQSKHIKKNQSWYHPAYLEGYNHLFNNTFSVEGFKAKLGSIDWDIKFVDGYISGYEYFKNLGNQILPVINQVRGKNQLLYADFPDMIHDTIGHAPMLFNKDYVSFLKKIYAIIESVNQKEIDKEYLSLQGVTKSEREQNLSKFSKIEEELKKNPTEFYTINNIALWTIEFGVLISGDNHKAYGAAIVASPLEIDNLINKKIPIKNLLNIDSPSFNFSELQDELYSTEKLENVIDFMLSNNRSNLNKSRLNTYIKAQTKDSISSLKKSE